MLDVDLSAYECTEMRLGHVAAERDEGIAAASQIKIEWTELGQRIDELALASSGAAAIYAEKGAGGLLQDCSILRYSVRVDFFVF